MRYVPALDGLRALAVMLVFLFHTSAHFPGGWIGVDIFFVLSGFLITSILVAEHEKTGAISLSRFYMRRAYRLLPALLVVLCVTVTLFAWLGIRTHDTVIDAAGALLYVADYHYALTQTNGSPLTHTWSLSVEEQFYFIWPLLLIVLLRWSRSVAFRATLGLIVVVAIWRGFLLFTSADPVSRTYFAFDTRADELLIGCALALWRPQLTTARLPRYSWPVVVLVLAAVVLKVGRFSGPSLPYVGTVGYPLLGIAVANLILVVMNDERSVLTYVLSRPPIVAFGRISYGFYLWHLPMFYLAANRRPEAFLLALAAATASYWLIERPFLRYAHSGGMSLRLPRPGIVSCPVVTEEG